MLKKLIFIFCWISLMATPVQAATLRVACAANFTSPMKELAKQYRSATGDKIACTFGSTGMLYGQIINGAPYDLFFAADEKRPNMLFDQRQAERPVLYAKGTVVVWSAKTALASMPNWKEVVLAPASKRVGMASPKTAPYGLNAEKAMRTTGILKTVTPKLAYGKSVGVSFQYAYSRAVDSAFIALSQALSDKGLEGRYWIVPEADLVNQAACVLKRGNTQDAAKFLKWLNSNTAREIITRYGYE
ncbi:molybdate ABC transporter substrate-binding protein [Pseudodesulfovibrio sp.]|nr:molybdate ABC transporter substrate-binding protein [Pseudodesulfovibrio sp.]